MGAPAHAPGERARARARPDRRLARRVDESDRRAPRAVRRFGVSHGAVGPRDLVRRTDRRRRRRLRRDHRGALVQEADDHPGSSTGDHTVRGIAIRSGDRQGVPADLARGPAQGNGPVVVDRSTVDLWPHGSRTRRVNAGRQHARVDQPGARTGDQCVFRARPGSPADATRGGHRRSRAIRRCATSRGDRRGWSSHYSNGSGRAVDAGRRFAAGGGRRHALRHDAR